MTQTELETHLITTPATPARRPLTEEEIEETFGPMIWDALCAFASDPNYFADIAEAAALIEYKQEIHRANKLGAERPDRPYPSRRKAR